MPSRMEPFEQTLHDKPLADSVAQQFPAKQFSRINPWLTDTQQPRCIAAQDSFPVCVAQSGDAEDMIDAVGISHFVRIIRAQNNLAGADFGDQMPEPLRRIDQGIEVELLEIFTRVFLEGFTVRRDKVYTVVRTANVGW